MSLSDERPADLWAAVKSMQETLDQHSDLLGKLAEYFSENRPTLEEIIHCVCEFYEVQPRDVRGHGRVQEYSRPRLITYYLARKLTRLSLHNIADRLGDRDHATIYTGYQRTMQRLRNGDEILRDDLDVLRCRIGEVVMARQRRVAS
jgi:chromosomal replication initiation ATPase DnaA